MDTLGKQLLTLRKLKGFTQIQVAENMTAQGFNVRNNYISRWEQNKGEPSLQQFFYLCEIYGVQDVLGTFWKKDALPKINEKGKQLVNDIMKAVELSGLYMPKSTPLYTRPIKVYEMPVSAGTGQFLDDVQYTIVEVDDTVPMDADFGLPVAGDSMEPRFYSGEIAWIHEQRTLDDGQIGVFSLNGDAYIKMLDTASKQTNLVSLNNKYAPIKVMEGDNLVAFGKVVGKSSNIDIFS